MSFSAILGTGANALAVGMGIVFSALVILIGSIVLMNKAVNAGNNRSSKKSEKSVPAPEPEMPVEMDASGDDDDEVVAVIMAAVAAMGQAEGRVFRLKAFRRTGETPAWNKAGRQLIMDSHE